MTTTDTFTLDAASDRVLLGDWVCQKAGASSNQTVTKALPAALCAAGAPLGIVMGSVAGDFTGGARITVGIAGIVSDAITNLSAGMASEVMVDADARSVRVALPSGAEFIGGQCDTNGLLTLNPRGVNVTAPLRTFNPRTYGCPWDGVHDDLAGLKAMMAAMSESQSSVAYRVDLPAGMGYVSDSWLIDKCAYITGRGGGGAQLSSGITSAAGTTPIIVDNGVNSPNQTTAEFCHIENLTLLSKVLVRMTDIGYGIGGVRQASTHHEKGNTVLAANGANPGVFFRALTSGSSTGAVGDPAGFSTAVPGQTFQDGGILWQCESLVAPRQSDHAYRLGDRYMNVGPNKFGEDDNRYYYECSVAGTSAATAPGFLEGPSIGTTFADGTATFVTRVHAGVLVNATSTLRRLKVANVTNYAVHAEGTTLTSADFFDIRDLFVPAACGGGLYVGTSEANGVSVWRVVALIASATYLPFDVGRVVKRPKLKDTLARRILSESDVHKLLVTADQSPAHRRTPMQETSARRNYVLLLLLYAAGLRVDKIARLAWRDLPERGDAGQITAYGKGGKRRVVLLPVSVWHELDSIRDGAPADAPVFASRTKAGFVSTTQVRRLVYAAAAAASLDERPSPHWLRHADATHALKRGAAIHLVQATICHASVATTGRYLHARPTDSSARYLPVYAGSPPVWADEFGNADGR